MAQVRPGQTLTEVLHQTLLGDAWDHAEEAVVVFDDDRNYLAFNEAYCALTGYSREEITAFKAGALDADDLSYDGFEERIQTGVAGIARARLLSRDGSATAVCFRIIRTTVAGLPYLIALVWRDRDTEASPR